MTLDRKKIIIEKAEGYSFVLINGGEKWPEKFMRLEIGIL